MVRYVLFTILLCLAAGAAALDVSTACAQPARPAIPDGSKTTREALLDARTALEKYLADGDAYLTCLRDYEKRLGEGINDVDGHEFVTRYNAMIDDMYLAGDEFNVALRRFKNQGDSAE